MVNDNETTEPKKRRGLFGARKAAAAHVSATTPGTTLGVGPESGVDTESGVPSNTLSAEKQTTPRKPAARKSPAKKVAENSEDSAAAAAATDALAANVPPATRKISATSLLFQAPPAVDPLPERAARAGRQPSRQQSQRTGAGTSDEVR
jgi:hypothetical protein